MGRTAQKLRNKLFFDDMSPITVKKQLVRRLSNQSQNGLRLTQVPRDLPIGAPGRTAFRPLPQEGLGCWTRAPLFPTTDRNCRAFRQDAEPRAGVMGCRGKQHSDRATIEGCHHTHPQYIPPGEAFWASTSASRRTGHASSRARERSRSTGASATRKASRRPVFPGRMRYDRCRRPMSQHWLAGNLQRAGLAGLGVAYLPGLAAAGRQAVRGRRQDRRATPIVIAKTALGIPDALLRSPGQRVPRGGQVARSPGHTWSPAPPGQAASAAYCWNRAPRSGALADLGDWHWLNMLEKLEARGVSASTEAGVRRRHEGANREDGCGLERRHGINQTSKRRVDAENPQVRMLAEGWRRRLRKQ